MRRITTFFIQQKISLFLIIFCSFAANVLVAQQTTISNYVLFGGAKSGTIANPTAPPSNIYGALFGSSTTIQGGSIGSYYQVTSTGNATITANIYSGGRIQLSNSNVLTGNITAADLGSPFVPTGGTVLNVGSSANITGNIDVNGNIVIGGGTVNGTVTHPEPTTYILGGSLVPGFGIPKLAVLPDMPPITQNLVAGSINLSNAPSGGINPGKYGNVTFSGKQKLLFKGPGEYVFNSITNTGNSNEFVFDFQNKPGVIKIYVIGNVDLGKIAASNINGGGPSKIYTEIQGKGSIACNISNGASGQAAKWLGTIWAPYGAINVGSGTGSSFVTGALWSGTQVNLQSGVTMNFDPFNICNVNANAGVDKALQFTGKTILTGTSSTSGTLNYSWQAGSGGVFDPLGAPTNTNVIGVSSAGIYTLTVTDPTTGCSSSDNVEVTSKLKNIIGSELQSIYENKTTDNTFFDILNGYVKIDIIVLNLPGKRAEVINKLLETNAQPLYVGLRDTLPNGLSRLTITGRYNIDSLLNLNNLGSLINYVRPYYRPILFRNVPLGGDTSEVGLRSQGDTTMKSHLVKGGYDIYGNGIKVGVISDSYANVINSTQASAPFNPLIIAPYSLPGFTIGTINTNPQQFKTNTYDQDIANGDLPGALNPFGYTKNVNVLADLPAKGTDEGRAMLQIVHDVAPAAELYFRTGFFTAGDFAKGIKDLKDAGCDIIVDDVTYITEPFLKDGVVAKSVNDQVQDQKLTYFSAAGNFANKSYEANFKPVTISTGVLAGKTAHDFGGGKTYQKLRLGAGNYTFVFQWVDNIYSLNETTGTINDLDIYLTKNTDGTGLVGYNRDNLVGDPIEFIPFTLPGTPGVDSVDYNILIINNNPANPAPRMKYIVFRGGIRFMEGFAGEGASTLVSQANAAGCIAVGATRYNYVPGYTNNTPAGYPGQTPNNPANPASKITKPKIENFSSIGGTLTNGESTPRNKPELVGPDGGNTTVKLGPDYPDWALDGFSNFLGTSAAAPHAAGAAALIFEGRKRYLGVTSTTTAEIKTLLQNTAVDMDVDGFDYISGYGLVDADSAMRTFAAPRPRSIRLVVPTTDPIVIPGNQQFLLTITGENFSVNSEIWIGDTKLTTYYISPTRDTIMALIPPFTGNPEIRVYTTPKTNYNDGGFSNSLYFFSANVVIKATGNTIKYGQQIPTTQQTINTLVTINGKPLQDTTVTLADLGLDNNLKYIVTATVNSKVGTYNIVPDFATLPGDALLKKYNYDFVNGNLNIEKMPLTITPLDKVVNYGDKIGDITFDYRFDPAYPLADATKLLNEVKSFHQSYLPKNALAVINDFSKTQSDGTTLTEAKLLNLNMMASFNAVKNSRKFSVLNNKLVSVINPKSLNLEYLLDISSVSIYDYFKDPTKSSFINGFTGISNKAILSANSLSNRTGTVQLNDFSSENINTGTLVQMVNDLSGSLAPISDGSLVQIVNGNISGSGTLVQLVNNGDGGTGTLVQLVNGELVPVANGTLVQLVNGTVTNQNGTLVQLVNGVSTAVPTGSLVQLVNGGTGSLVQLVNGLLAPIPNGTLVQLPNGGGGTGRLVKLLLNGELVADPTGTLVQLVNDGSGSGSLVQMVNGTASDVNNGSLVQLVNGGTGTLVQLVNSNVGTLVQLVNGNSTSTLNYNSKTAIIFDQADLPNKWVGPMFGINMITGLGAGNQKLVPGVFINNNFEIRYGLGNVEIRPETITITPDLLQKKVYGNLDPTLTYKADKALVPGETFSGTLTRAAGETVDNYAIIQSGLTIKNGAIDVTSNYNIVYKAASFEITKLHVTVTANVGQTKVYGAANPASYTYTSIPAVASNLANGDAIGFTGAQVRAAGENVGAYAISQGTLNNTNYNITYSGDNFTITQLPVTITAAAKTKVYGAVDPPLTYTSIPAAGSVLANGSDVSFTGSLSRTTGENIGIYAIGSTLTNTNYNIAFTSANFSITKRPITIAVTTGQSKLYGDSDPIFVYSVTPTGTASAPALRSGDAFSGALTRVLGENVGNYNILQAGLTIKNGITDVASNYTITYVGTSFAILTNPCLITHNEVTNFGSTANPNTPTSLWFSLTTKVSGQLVKEGDSLLFRAGDVTFSNIASTPAVTNFPLPAGRIIAKTGTLTPNSSYDSIARIWTTYVPLGYSSTSDIFVTGAIINSSTGFVKKNNAKHVARGIFYSNVTFKDQWGYAMAAYQRPSTTYIYYRDVYESGAVLAINGSYRAGTPLNILKWIVNGASGGGGNNYTGSPSSFDNFTACPPRTNAIVSRSINNAPLVIALKPALTEVNVINSDEIKIYPNPASNFIQLSFVAGGNGSTEITLSTIDGKKVYGNDFGVCEKGKMYNRQIDVSKLTRGVYILQLITNNKITIKKVIINR